MTIDVFQLWDLLEPQSLFDRVSPLNGEYDDETHLAYITALLGPAPEDLLNDGRRTAMFYNSNGEPTSTTTVLKLIPTKVC